MKQRSNAKLKEGPSSKFGEGTLTRRVFGVEIGMNQLRKTQHQAAPKTANAAIAGLRNCFFGLALVSGCTHHTDAVHELHSAVAPFTQTRNQAVGLVTTAKHSLGASDLNTLAVAYAALEEKGNAYSGFLVEAVTDTSFDVDRNAKYAADLTTAIKAFNKSFASVSPPNQAGASVQSAWIPAFSNSVTAYWKQYHDAMATLSPQTKTDLIKQLKAETVWPRYESIATEPVTAPTPH